MKNKNVIIVLVAAVVVILLLVFLLPKNTAKDKPATYDSSAGTKPATGNNTSGGGIAETAIENAAGIISSIGGLIGAIRNKKKDNAAKSAENTNSQQVIV